MRIILDDSVCEKNNISSEEVIILLCVDKAYSYLNVKDKLIEKGLMTVGLMEDQPSITKKGIELLNKIFIEADKGVPNMNTCRTLAVTLREIFPPGLKDGKYSWRGNTKDVAGRLQKFFKLYGSQWTPEEIIDATTRYVASFNGDYTKMRLLGYFIIKQDRERQELISDLATWLENPEMEDNYQDDNWLTSLI